MGFVEDIRGRQERTKAGLGAKQDRPSVIFAAWIVGIVSVAEDTPTQSDELPMLFLLHQAHYLTSTMNTSNALICN